MHAILTSTRSSAQCAVENATCIDRRGSSNLANISCEVHVYVCIKSMHSFWVFTRESLRFSCIRFQSIHLNYWIQKLLDSLGICIEFDWICVNEHPIR